MLIQVLGACEISTERMNEGREETAELVARVLKGQAVSREEVLWLAAELYVQAKAASERQTWIDDLLERAEDGDLF